MSAYQELIAQKNALDAQIVAAKKAEIADAVAKARALVKDHNLTAEDIFAPAKRIAGERANKGVKVAAKYRNVATGESWTGRGKEPAWIKGQDRAQYLIA